jgi:hypothetical protein
LRNRARCPAESFCRSTLACSFMPLLAGDRPSSGF